MLELLVVLVLIIAPLVIGWVLTWRLRSLRRDPAPDYRFWVPGVVRYWRRDQYEPEAARLLFWWRLVVVVTPLVVLLGAWLASSVRQLP
jgi:hypothetical protein